MEGYSNFILLSCSQEEGLGFLESSLLAGTLKSGNRIIILCFGLNVKHLDKFRYLGAEIIILKLQDTDRESDLEMNLLLDLMSALNGGVLGLKLSGYSIAGAKLSCTDSIIWQDGFRLLEMMRKSKFVGQTGTVVLDSRGQRTNLTISVLEMTRKGLVTGAIWTENNGYLKSKGKTFKSYDKSLNFISILFSLETHPTLPAINLIFAVIISI